MSNETRYRTFREFYPFYLSEHKNRTSRRLHFIGDWRMWWEILTGKIRF